MSNKVLKIVFLTLGFALFGWALVAVDIKSVLDLMVQLGWGFLLVLAIYSVVTWVDTISWRYAFKPDEAEKIGLFPLWKIRQIGESFNTITPFGTMGGEPVKAQLIKDHIGLSFKQGVASQVVARTTFLTALICFMVPGILFLLNSATADENFKTISVSLISTFTTAIFLFFLFQATGSLGKVMGFLARLIPPLRGSEFLDHMVELDQLMSGYYRRYPARLGLSIGYAVAGWIIGLGELYVTLYFLGVEVSLTDLWIMEAVSQLIRVCSFFIPLSIGAQEGGFILIFSSIGLTADIGLAVSFVRRVKELVWVGMGLALGGRAAMKPPATSQDE